MIFDVAEIIVMTNDLMATDLGIILEVRMIGQ